MRQKETARKGDILSRDRRMMIAKEIISYFSREHEMDFGMIAAEDILDFLLQEVTSDIYRKGVEDAQVLMRQRMEAMEVDLSALGR